MGLEVVRCPECGGLLVDSSVIANTAACRGCNWAGTKADLLVDRSIREEKTPGVILTGQVDEKGPTPEYVAQRFFSALRNTIAQYCAVPIGRFLIESGFCDVSDKKVLSRYLAAAATGMAKAVIAERAEIEKEKSSG